MVHGMALRPALALVITLAFVAPSAPQSIERPLFSGVPFPNLVGKSLSGSNITVGMGDGLAKIMVITFTREAANPAQAWLDACRADETVQPGVVPTQADAPAAPGGAPVPPAPRVVCYDVRMAQAVPFFIRGYLEGRMKKGLSPEQLARVVLVYSEKEAWRDRLVVMSNNENEPFIVMVDRQGRVQSLLQGPFNPAALKAEQAKLRLP
jgi:hypothetical protein